MRKDAQLQDETSGAKLSNGHKSLLLQGPVRLSQELCFSSEHPSRDGLTIKG